MLKKYYLGIDEAGRGPIIGSLFICGVLTDKEIVDEEVKDSKLLSDEKRNEIFEKYKDKVKFFIYELKPEEIDNENLNELEVKYFAKIINESINYLKKKKKEFELNVFIDLPEKKDKFLKRLSKYLNKKENLNLILEHKADSKYKIVSLASIFAKVHRENHVKKLKKQIGDFGSGYPSDPNTRKFLESVKENKEMFKAVNKYLRKKWSTYKKIFGNEKRRNLLDFLENRRLKKV